MCKCILSTSIRYILKVFFAYKLRSLNISNIILCIYVIFFFSEFSHIILCIYVIFLKLSLLEDELLCVTNNYYKKIRIMEIGECCIKLEKIGMTMRDHKHFIYESFIVINHS
jgi:hypothetical protein